MFLLGMHPDDMGLVLCVCSPVVVSLVLLLIIRPRAAIAACSGGSIAFLCFLAGNAILRANATSTDAYGMGLIVSILVSAVVGSLVAFTLYDRVKKKDAPEQDERDHKGDEGSREPGHA